MSDPEVPEHERPRDVDHVVDSANAGLDAAAAAGADVPGGAARNESAAPEDPDLAAFEAAEREHPGTFTSPPADEPRVDARSGADAAAETDAGAAAIADDTAEPDARAAAAAEAADRDADTRAHASDEALDADARISGIRSEHEESAMAGAAYSSADDTETRIVPSEPVPSEPVVATPLHQQPIFVQAPEPPRERGNRGTAGAIGLLATIVFAILYLGATLGLGVLTGDVTGENIGEAALEPLRTWGFWVPVVTFFLGFWLLGAFINRGRWGLWVIFGIIVGAIAYGGHILGQLFEAPFWLLTPSDASELVNSQLLAPLAIAAFIFGRELTIWFGAWVARSGARKTELNEEAQREYERTLEAGPTLAR